MIKQMPTITKTASTTITIAEMGDILCNSANAQTYTLPTATKGLWYWFGNIGAGVVTISNGGTLATLAQYESCIVLNNGTVWYAVKGANGATGPQGETGIQGIQGIQGEPGSPGTGSATHWEPVVTGGLSSEILFDNDGDLLMAEVLN